MVPKIQPVLCTFDQITVKGKLKNRIPIFPEEEERDVEDRKLCEDLQCYRFFMVGVKCFWLT